MNKQMMQWYEDVTNRLWRDDLRQLHGWRRVLVIAVRLVVVTIRQLLNGELNLRAMSLVYTTLLSVVPLLAVSFSVLKGFGVHNQIEPLLLNFLAPLGSRGVELTNNIITFVENIKVGVLGSVGLVFLLYTVVSLIQKIESAFNSVWQVGQMRGLVQRISNYLSVILIGPVLVFAALGLTATAMSHSVVQQLLSVEHLGDALLTLSKLAPYMLIIAAFTFIYLFIPNTRVKASAALIGGVVAGVLWQSSGWAFAAFIASSSKYAAIYSGFAIVIMLLIWLYVNWLVLLLGAQVAFYLQYPQYLTRHPVALRPSNRLRERLALQLMFLVADNYVHGRDPWTAEALIGQLGLPMEPVHATLRLMVDSGFLAETGNEPPAYLPRQDVDTIGLAQLYEVVRSAGENRFLTIKLLPHQQQVEDVMAAIQHATRSELGERTLKDLVTRPDR
jgi:membrane protein